MLLTAFSRCVRAFRRKSGLERGFIDETGFPLAQMTIEEKDIASCLWPASLLLHGLFPSGIRSCIP